MMQKIFMWARLVFSLGIGNVIRNIIYRLKLKTGFFAQMTPVGQILTGQLFGDELTAETNFQIDNEIKELIVKEAKLLANGHLKLFFNQGYQAGSPPRWFYYQEDIFKGHWSNSPVNEYLCKDIKLTWDLSRFHWLQQLSCAYLVTEDKVYIDLINSWFEDWSIENPVNSGVNWSCAQECSIRVIHVLNSTHILNNVQLNLNGLIDFVIAHCLRIEPTISYAISQDNNHGTSEAAALFICGAWLLKQPQVEPDNRILAKRCTSKGRRILEERVSKLIFTDGGFSMYSTNYHRVVLNTVSIVEFWRRELSQEVFTKKYISKCQSAINWLFHLTDDISGDTLNLGANDGSNPFIVQSIDYRDYRPSIQLASVLFFNEKKYKEDCKIDEPLDWLNIKHSFLKQTIETHHSKLFPQSGIIILRSKDISALNSTVFVKYPCYKFRPNQADVLHIDMWHKGENILRDAGSYSYNGERSKMDYFASIRAHNAVEIDQTEPMPRLGPFLLADWVKMNSVGQIIKTADCLSWEGGYKVKKNTLHNRQVFFSENRWSVIDTIDGASEGFILRWRLKPTEWLLENNVLACRDVRIEIETKRNQQVEFKLISGLESKYYNTVNEIPVLEVRVTSRMAEISTHIYIEDV